MILKRQKYVNKTNNYFCLYDYVCFNEKFDAYFENV